MKNLAVLAGTILLLLPMAVSADEQTREIQEELRKRHIFYGDIDGQMTPALATALQRYQERKHLPVTGTVNEETRRSLGLWVATPPGAGPPAAVLPDVAVLKSDQRIPEKGTAMPPGPPPPAEGPLKSTPISRDEAKDFVAAYFTACENRDIDNELKFYADRVDYYDHGTVDRTYIRNELAVYDQHWPSRDYTPSKKLRVSDRRNNIVVRGRTGFNVSNPTRARQARGRTNNMFEIARGQDDQLEIVSIHETRVRSRARARRPANPMAGALRRFGGTLRSLFH